MRRAGLTVLVRFDESTTSLVEGEVSSVMAVSDSERRGCLAGYVGRFGKGRLRRLLLVSRLSLINLSTDSG